MDNPLKLEVTLTKESAIKSKEELKEITIKDILYFEIRTKDTNEVVCRWENPKNLEERKKLIFLSFCYIIFIDKKMKGEIK